MTEAPSIAEIVTTAERLVGAVNYDVCGINGQGGNGGLTSTETVRACDEMRLAIARWRSRNPPASSGSPTAGQHGERA